jgi:phospholipid/cholesterol/gamma-HCH transport system substrate-binding protein
MIRRRIKIQLMIFAVISALGVAYVGLRYVGVPGIHRTYTVNVDLAESGGIFSNAEVTYRGVAIGRVGKLELRPHSVRVQLKLNPGVKIPSDTRAVVENRSAVGEQYVDLQPARNGGPYLRAGDVIPVGRTRTPLPIQDLLLHVDDLATSVPLDQLSGLLDELNKAFAGVGPDLQKLLDSTDALLADAQQNLPQTTKLLDDGKTVLDTQRQDSAQITAWAHSLAQLAATLRSSDSDLRQLLANTPGTETQVLDLIDQLQPNLGMLLGNLITVGGVTARRLPGIEQVLVTYPAVVAGGLTVAPGDGTAHFGLVVNLDNPPPCRDGYGTARPPTDTSDTPANTKVTCLVNKNSITEVRGSQNAPHPSGSDPGAPSPQPSSGPVVGQTGGSPDMSSGDRSGNVVGYDPLTGQVYDGTGQPLLPGATGGQQKMLGDQSWQWLLLGPLTN